MAKNEEGEFELVLGNRQLLSIFFIVVILFGVFFTMGYIVGRSSAPTMASTPAAVKSEAPAEQRASAAAPPTATEPMAAAPAPPKPAPASAAETVPARGEETPKSPAAEPGPGQMYLQVAAVIRSDAENEVATLRKRGFPAQIAPSPREGIYRVLVGPYGDAASLGKAKADLENLGFKPLVRK